MGLTHAEAQEILAKPDRPAKPKVTAPPELVAQIKRLKGYHRWADFAEEALRALWTHAYDYEHAERVVTHILDTRRPNENGFIVCPSPAEIKDYCEMVPLEPEKKPEPSKDCPDCYGSGFRTTERNGYTGATPCECRGVK